MWLKTETANKMAAAMLNGSYHRLINYWGWQTCPGPTSGVHGEYANRGDRADSASNVQSIEDNI